MWILKNLLWLLLLIAVGGFAIWNVNGRVSEIRLPGVVYANLPLTVVLFATFVLGMLVAFLLTAVQYLKGRAAMGKLTRENQHLREELKAIRNLPIEDLRMGDGGGDEA